MHYISAGGMAALVARYQQIREEECELMRHCRDGRGIDVDIEEGLLEMQDWQRAVLLEYIILREASERAPRSPCPKAVCTRALSPRPLLFCTRGLCAVLSFWPFGALAPCALLTSFCPVSLFSGIYASCMDHVGYVGIPCLCRKITCFTAVLLKTHGCFL